MMLTEWGYTLVFDSDSDQFINFLHECLQGFEYDQSSIDSMDAEITNSTVLADPLARQSFIHIVGICLRAIRLGHFSFGHLIGLLTRYPTFDPVIQDLLKNMLMSSIKVFVLKSSNPAQVNHYIDSLGIALTSSFDKWQSRTIDCEFKFITQLSRLIANSLRNVGSRLSWISEALIHFHESSSSKCLGKFKASIKSSSSDISQIDIQVNSTPSKSMFASGKRKAGDTPSSLQKLIEEDEGFDNEMQENNASPSSSKKSKRN